MMLRTGLGGIGVHPEKTRRRCPGPLGAHVDTRGRPGTPKGGHPER